MSSRLQPVTSSASGSLSSTSNDAVSCSATSLSTHSPTVRSTEPLSFRKVWVDPASLPNHGDITHVAGNAPAYVKQLTSNTLASYGVGNDDCFAQAVGKAIKFVEVNVNKNADRQGRLEAITIADVVVSKNMLNGAGMLHGGCIAYLIDICCSTPLIALGLLQSVNGVGVTQGLSIFFHSPAALGTCLRIISTSVSLGGRVMSSRCEIISKKSGRVVASAHLNKMQPTMPTMSKL